MTLVIDASVALKWFLTGESYAAEALAIVREGTPLIAPDLLIAEVCNAAWRSARLGRLGEAQVAEIAALLPSFFDSLVGAVELAPRAVAIASQADHPVYDCLYVALAEIRQVNLVTADMRLIGKLHHTPWAAHVRHLTDQQA